MTRITRCPSCAVVYKLDASHVQAAQGWLRCGKCHEVFNVTGLDVAAPVVLLPLTSDAVAAPAGNTLTAQTAPRLDLDDLLLREDRSTQPNPSAQEISAELMAFSEALATFKPVSSQLESTAVEIPATQHTRARFFLFAMVLGLGLMLMAQVFFSQRHFMAALWPSSLHVLESLCRPFQCKVKPWMNPKALVIEDASFAQSGDVFVLNWSLRNVGPMAVATTSFELSLLDEFNNPVVRRVFLSEETQAPATLSPGQVWKGSVPVQVDPSLVFSQYRLLSFYP